MTPGVESCLKTDAKNKGCLWPEQEKEEEIHASKARFKPEVGLSTKKCRAEYLSLVRNLDQELELGGRMEAYVTKRIQWEENRHLKAQKEPFHLQFVGKYHLMGFSIRAHQFLRSE